MAVVVLSIVARTCHYPCLGRLSLKVGELSLPSPTMQKSLSAGATYGRLHLPGATLRKYVH